MGDISYLSTNAYFIPSSFNLSQNCLKLHLTFHVKIMNTKLFNKMFLS